MTIDVPHYRLPKSRHLRASRDFQRAFDKRCKAGDSFLLVFAVPNDLDYTRFGLSVSRKQGPAVVRNRLKRLLREAFRLSQHELPPGLDLVLIPSREHRGELSDYRRSLVRLAGKLSRRLAAESEAPS